MSMYHQSPPGTTVAWGTQSSSAGEVVGGAEAIGHAGISSNASAIPHVST